MKRSTPLALLLPLALAACSSSSDSSTAPPATATTIFSTLTSEGLNTLQAALVAAGLDDDLAGAGPFTLLAPSDAAFDALPPGTLDALLLPENQATLIDILTYHVIVGEATSDVVVTLDSSSTLQGASVLIDQVGDALFINDAQVTKTDVDATNGVIHVIDKVILPPQNIVDTLVANGFDTLAAAVGAAGLVDTLSGATTTENFTVLAPTDAAFAALPAGVLDDLLLDENKDALIDILTYHVVSGDVVASAALAAESPKALNAVTLLFAASEAGAAVNGVSISAVNIPCTNGVIHVIDAVLLPPSEIPTLAGEAGLSTLVAALTAGELVEALAAGGPFTVFAPTNAAFDALPEGALGVLLDPANKGLLVDVLLYHVVADELTAAEVLGATSFSTLNGDSINVSANPPMINEAPIALTNVLARNGIVHVIDAVLLPPGFVLPATEQAPSAETPLSFGAEFGSQMSDFSEFASETLPTWHGAPGTRASGWDDFASLTNPVRPDVEGSGNASLYLELPSRDSQAGTVQWASTSANFRVSQRSAQVPQEVILNWTSAGVEATPVLSFVDVDGEVIELEPTSIQVRSSRVSDSTETIATWVPAFTGQAIDSFNVVVKSERSGFVLESLRILSID